MLTLRDSVQLYALQSKFFFPLGDAHPSVGSLIICVKVVWALSPFGLSLVFLYLPSKTVH